MATRKTTTKEKIVKPRTAPTPRRVTRVAAVTTPEPVSATSATPARRRRLLPLLLLIILLGTALFFLAQRYRGQLVAAFVNRTPITRFELNRVLTQRYGQAVLDELINTRILREEAGKQGITVSSEDINEEIKALQERLGGNEALQAALTQYGLSREDLDSQVELRLMQQKLTDKLFPVTVSDEDAQKYFDQNKVMFEGQKFEDVKEEVLGTLKEQQLQEKFTTWFEELKSKARINIFI